jgi:hypothetical protein
MLEEVAKLGFYSAWNDIKVLVTAYPGEEVLVVADVDEIYGQNWYVCVTEEAKEAYYWEANAAARLIAAAEEAARLAEEVRVAEEKALDSIIVTEQPLTTRMYTSATSSATEFEISASDASPSRAPLCVRLARRRRAYGAPLVLAERDSATLIADFRPRRDTNHETRRRTFDAGVQIGASSSHMLRVEAAAQTTYNPRRDAASTADLDVTPPVADWQVSRVAGAGAAWSNEIAYSSARAAAVKAALAGESLRAPLIEPIVPEYAGDLRSMIDEIVLLSAQLEGEPPPEAPSKSAIAIETALKEAAKVAAAADSPAAGAAVAGGGGGGRTHLHV